MCANLNRMQAAAVTTNGEADVHEQLRVIMTPLSLSRSTLLNGISSHVVADAITLTQIDNMHRSAQNLKTRMPLYIGSIDGKIHVSAHLADAVKAAPSKHSGKKRQRVSDSDERATDVIRGVKKRLNGASSHVSEEQLEAGRLVVRQLVDLKGSAGENVLESIGLSVSGTHTSIVNSRRPRLMLSARFAPGIAIPLGLLRSSISTCSDGALTTKTSGLGTQFSLPVPSSASYLVADGQVPIFLHIAIPEPSSTAARESR